jgi:hypothetical protein
MMAMILLVACVATWMLVALLLRDAAPRLVSALAGEAGHHTQRPWRPTPVRMATARRPAMIGSQPRSGSGRIANRAFSRAWDRTAIGRLAA